VPFFSNNEYLQDTYPNQVIEEHNFASHHPSSNDIIIDSIYHDDPLKNAMIRQKVKSNSKIPIQIMSIQEKERNPYMNPQKDPNHAYVKELSDELQKAVEQQAIQIVSPKRKELNRIHSQQI